MQYPLFLLLLLFFAYYGACFTRKLNINQLISKLVINLVLGLTLFVMQAHILALLTHNLLMSAFCSGLASMIIIFWKQPFKFELKSIQWSDGITFVTAFCCGLGMFLQDQAKLNPDRIHIAHLSGLIYNNIYPPLSIGGKKFLLSDYHYGPDLLAAVIKLVTGLEPYEVISLQIGLGAFLLFLSLFALIRYFSISNKNSLIASITVFFYTSINALQYFVQEVTSIGRNGFFTDWLLASWTSISHVLSQLRLPSQNITMPSLVILLLLIFILLDTRSQKQIWLLVPLSFFTYFSYPAFWYPVFCASGLYVAFSLLKHCYIQRVFFTKAILISSLFEIYFLIALYLGRMLSFGTMPKGLNISPLIVQPTLEWLNWGKSYLLYFYTLDYLKSLVRLPDLVTGESVFKVPLFSSITFRDFGFCVILATILVFAMIWRKKSHKILFLYASGLISISVPFIIQFVLRPIETTRFIFAGKFLLIIFIALAIIVLFEKAKIATWFSIGFIALLLILIMPGLRAVIPDRSCFQWHNTSFLDAEKQMITQLQTLHHSGDVVLDPKLFVLGAKFSSLAGFYNIGGQLYKLDDITFATAYDSMNPLLLQQLEVQYVIVYPDTKLTERAKLRLSDQNLFRLYSFPDTGLKVYQCLNPLLDQSIFDEEFKWVIVYQEPKSFLTYQEADGSIPQAKNKAELLAILNRAKEKFKSQNLAVAYWLNIQAVPSNSQTLSSGDDTL